MLMRLHPDDLPCVSNRVMANAFTRHFPGNYVTNRSRPIDRIHDGTSHAVDGRDHVSSRRQGADHFPGVQNLADLLSDVFADPVVGKVRKPVVAERCVAIREQQRGDLSLVGACVRKERPQSLRILWTKPALGSLWTPCMEEAGPAVGVDQVDGPSGVQCRFQHSLVSQLELRRSLRSWWEARRSMVTTVLLFRLQ
jgi:hypothetical protein